MGILRRTVLVAASLAAVLLLLAQSPAGAHAAVESSDPSDGAVLDAPVSEITLVFTDQAEPIGDGFQIIESDGEIRTPNEWRSPDGRTFVLYFDPPITGGEIGMQWTIRSGDTHGLNGGFSFTVDAPDPAPAVPVDEAPATVDDAEVPVLESAERGPADTTERAADEQAAGATIPSSSSSDQKMIESVAVALGPGPTVDDAELNGTAGMRLLGLVGRLSGMLGSLVVIGAVVFLIRVLRGTLGEGRLVVLIARRAALVVVVGAIAEAAAQVAVQGGGWGSMLSPPEWIETLSSRFGGALGLHLIGAFGVSTGSLFGREPIGHQSSETIRAEMARAGALAAGVRSSGAANHPPLDNAEEIGASRTPPLFRWHPTSASSGAVLGIVALLAAAVVDGHTLGGSGPQLSAALTLTHVLAGSIWVGGVVVLFALLRRRFRAQRRVEAVDLAVRYSVLATVSLIGVALAGLLLTYTHVESISDIWTTGWGRLVLAKLGLVAIASSLGALNHFVVIPRLVTRSDDIGLGDALKRLVAVEIVVLAVVVALSAQLVVVGL